MKTCTKCGETKALTEFYTTKHNRTGLLPECKACTNKYARTYRINNAEKCRERDRQYSKKWRVENPEKAKQSGLLQQRRWQAANPEKVAQLSKNYNAKLLDSYVLKTLTVHTGIAKENIPPELIELKRAQLKLQRLIKEKQK